MKNRKASFWKKSLFAIICMLGMHQSCSGANPFSIQNYVTQAQMFLNGVYAAQNRVPSNIHGTDHTKVGRYLFGTSPTDTIHLAELDDSKLTTYPIVRGMLNFNRDRARGKIDQSDINKFLQLRDKIGGAIAARKSDGHEKTKTYFIAAMLLDKGVKLSELEGFGKKIEELENKLAAEEMKNQADQKAADKRKLQHERKLELKNLDNVGITLNAKNDRAINTMKLKQESQDKLATKAMEVKASNDNIKTKANEDRETNKKQIQNITKFISNPVVIGAGISFFGALIILFYMAKYGLKRLFTKPPPDFMKTSIPTTVWQRFLPGFFPPDTLPEQNIRGIYNPDVQEKLDKIFRENKKILEAQEKGHNVYLKNYLFWGPPGTGKTYFAQMLAQGENPDDPDFYYVLIPGNSVLQLPIQDALRAIKDVLAYARENSMGKPVIFIYDEADALFRARATADEATRKIVNLWLALVPKALSENEMHIFITNQPSVMDPAVISRSGSSVYIGKPDAETAYKIVKAYLYHASGEHNITISKEIKENQEEIGEACEGLVGRNLQLIVQTVMDSLLLENKSRLELETLLEAIKDYKKALKDLNDPMLDPLKQEQNLSRNNNVPVPG